MRTYAALLLALVLPASASLLPACSTTYYKTMEAFGKEKRDILASRVKSATKDQEEAKEQFQSALDRFSVLVNAQDSDLRRAYDRAKSDFEVSEGKAKDVRERVASVETVGNDLFDEWEKELNEYSSEDLRRSSRGQLTETRARFDQMLRAMKKAEASMEPVLAAFRDTVLYLKHNLNAQAVASMRGTVSELERDVAGLIRDMERSMAEADGFIKQLQQ
jgi:hypothetical protein